MSTVLGWFENSIAHSAPETTIEAMYRACPPPSPERHAQRVAAAMTLAVTGRAGECDLATDGVLWASIVGQARWNHAELVALAKRSGHAFALIEAYRRHGKDLFRYLRGAFSLAVLDESRNRALLAVDRIGIRSMCYSRPKSGGIVFGSNADSVRAHPAVDSTLSDQQIFDFLYFGVSPSPSTIYREQFKLLPAQYLIYEQGEVRTDFYWRVPYLESNERNVRDLSDELMRLLRTAVEKAIETENGTKIGAFLSGGLDSSTVSGLASEVAGKSVNTFTIGFSHDQYDETHYAEIAAQHFHTVQHSYYLEPKDVVAALDDVVSASDEPFGNSSVIPAYYCAKLAREHGMSLMLAGDGGDEIFAGNSRYVEQLILDLYRRLPTLLRKELVEPLVFGLPRFDKLRLARKIQNYIRRALIPMPDRLEALNFYRNADLAEVFERAILASIDPQEPLASLREVYGRAQSESTLQRMLHLDLKFTLADNDLRKVSIACGMASMPVAYPFLDEDVVEFAAQIPPSLLIRWFKRRWFFRQAVKDFLPADTLTKRKHGFGMPFAEWPRQDPELRDIAIDCLRRFSRRQYLRSDFIERVLSDRNTNTYDPLVWDIMILELWLRKRQASVSDVRGSRVVA